MSAEEVVKSVYPHRTKPLSLRRAQGFARCLQANSRFKNVGVLESLDGKTAHVLFRRAPGFGGENLSAEQIERLRRAGYEAPRYQFCRVAREVWDCCDPETGRTYRVARDGCGCMDFQHRCAPKNEHCKHVLALVLRGG